MIGLSNWISGIIKSSKALALEEQNKASEAWRRIMENPTIAVFMTPAGVKLPQQVVRLESDNRATMGMSAAGIAPIRQLIIYGIINHIYMPNTDMKEGYTFIYEKDIYKCKDVIVTLGEIQGIWEATG